MRATIESQPMFGLSTQMALDPSFEHECFNTLVRAYKWQLFLSARRLYLDKTHPNIWLAEKLKDAFPTALFIGIERNPYATVASMMKHKGVSGWHTRWHEFPIPNRFLGIAHDTVNSYDDIPLAEQCAMRWLAHFDRLRQLESSLGDDLLTISYESFANNPHRVIRQLERFIGVTSPIPVPTVRTESLNKWRSQLTTDEVQQIQAVVGFPPGASI